MKTAFIDLDGTLLGMNQDEFVRGYFGALSNKFKNIDQKKFIMAMGAGVEAMVTNDGSLSNENRFWQVFENILGIKKETLNDDFEEFYANDFDFCQKLVKAKEESKELINVLKKKGYRLILATNPLFPRIATEKRIKWANLNINDFDEVTTFENYHYCKPNVKYYQEIMDKFNVKEVIMIGNDLKEDGAIAALGVDVYIVNDDILNGDLDFSGKFIGSMKELVEYFKNN